MNRLLLYQVLMNRESWIVKLYLCDHLKCKLQEDHEVFEAKVSKIAKNIFAFTVFSFHKWIFIFSHRTSIDWLNNNGWYQWNCILCVISAKNETPRYVDEVSNVDLLWFTFSVLCLPLWSPKINQNFFPKFSWCTFLV